MGSEMSEAGWFSHGLAAAFDLARWLSFLIGRPAVAESVAGLTGMKLDIALISASLSGSRFLRLLLFLLLGFRSPFFPWCNVGMRSHVICVSPVSSPC